MARDASWKCEWLDEEEIYERAMMKGSQIGLEYQAPTTDIDRIMRSMMSPAFALSPSSSSQPQAGPSGVATTGTSPPPFPRSTAPIASGPWNNYGKKPDSLKNVLPPGLVGSGLSQITTSTSGGSTGSIAGPRASFASTIGANADALLTDEHGLALLSSSGSNVFSQPKHSALKSGGNSEGNTSEGTVVGGKRTRNGRARR